MQKESTLMGENQRVNDPQHRIDRIRVRCLANPAMPGRGFPLGQKVSTAQRPTPRAVTNLHIRVGIYRLRLLEFYVEFDISSIRIAYESCIAILQEIQKLEIDSMHAYGHATDFND